MCPTLCIFGKTFSDNKKADKIKFGGKGQLALFLPSIPPRGQVCQCLILVHIATLTVVNSVRLNLLRVVLNA